MSIRPIDIAKRLQISTSALRNYEEFGIVPPVQRGDNGYRIYTDVHVAYFDCICAMSPGFGMALTSDVMRLLIRGEIDDALWRVNDAMAALQQEKAMAEQTIRVLDTKELENLDARGRRKWMTIGEVSKETGLPASAIRHWEKMGLIEVSRSDENGYRTFSPTQIRQILIIGTLRRAVWSLDVIKRVISELDHNNLEQARQIARDSLQFMHNINRRRMRGIHFLHALIERFESRPAPSPDIG